MFFEQGFVQSCQIEEDNDAPFSYNVCHKNTSDAAKHINSRFVSTSGPIVRYVNRQHWSRVIQLPNERRKVNARDPTVGDSLISSSQTSHLTKSCLTHRRICHLLDSSRRCQITLIDDEGNGAQQLVRRSFGASSLSVVGSTALNSLLDDHVKNAPSRHLETFKSHPKTCLFHRPVFSKSQMAVADCWTLAQRLYRLWKRLRR